MKTLAEFLQAESPPFRQLPSDMRDINNRWAGHGIESGKENERQVVVLFRVDQFVSLRLRAKNDPRWPVDFSTFEVRE